MAGPEPQPPDPIVKRVMRVPWALESVFASKLYKQPRGVPEDWPAGQSLIDPGPWESHC